MYKNIITSIFIILFTFSCNSEIDPLNASAIKAYIIEKSFVNTCQYNTDNQTYTFNPDGTFIHISTNRRNGEIKNYKGQYEIKNSKYKDTGFPFVYLKLIYADNSWNNVPEYFVFDHNNLTKPEYHGETAAAMNIKPDEDASGLNIPNYLIKGALDCQIAYASTRINLSEASNQTNSTSSNLSIESAKTAMDSTIRPRAIHPLSKDYPKNNVEIRNDENIVTLNSARQFVQERVFKRMGKIIDEFINESYGHKLYTFLVSYEGNEKCNIIVSDIKLEILATKCGSDEIQSSFKDAKKLSILSSPDEPKENKLVHEDPQYEIGYYITNGSKNKYVYFHNAPDRATKRSAHFDSQETIYVQKIKNGFGYTEFTNIVGEKSIGWLNMNNLILKP